MAAAELPSFGGVEPSPAQQSQEPPVTAHKPGPDPSLDVLFAQQSQEPPVTAQKSIPIVKQQQAAPQETTFKLDELPRAIDPCRAPPTAQEPRRPRNGYESDYDHTVKGYGELTVVNGNSEDAAVML